MNLLKNTYPNEGNGENISNKLNEKDNSKDVSNKTKKLIVFFSSFLLALLLKYSPVKGQNISPTTGAPNILSTTGAPIEQCIKLNSSDSTKYEYVFSVLLRDLLETFKEGGIKNPKIIFKGEDYEKNFEEVKNFISISIGEENLKNVIINSDSIVIKKKQLNLGGANQRDLLETFVLGLLRNYKKHLNSNGSKNKKNKITITYQIFDEGSMQVGLIVVVGKKNKIYLYPIINNPENFTIFLPFVEINDDDNKFVRFYNPIRFLKTREYSPADLDNKNNSPDSGIVFYGNQEISNPNQETPNNLDQKPTEESFVKIQLGAFNDPKNIDRSVIVKKIQALGVKPVIMGGKRFYNIEIYKINDLYHICLGDSVKIGNGEIVILKDGSVKNITDVLKEEGNYFTINEPGNNKIFGDRDIVLKDPKDLPGENTLILVGEDGKIYEINNNGKTQQTSWWKKYYKGGYSTGYGNNEQYYKNYNYKNNPSSPHQHYRQKIPGKN